MIAFRKKERSRTSFQTMWIIFQQCEQQSKVLNYIKVKKKKYVEFVSSLLDFMGEKEKCDSNPYWNPKMIEVMSIIQFY